MSVLDVLGVGDEVEPARPQREALVHVRTVRRDRVLDAERPVAVVVVGAAVAILSSSGRWKNRFAVASRGAAAARRRCRRVSPRRSPVDDVAGRFADARWLRGNVWVTDVPSLWGEVELWMWYLGGPQPASTIPRGSRLPAAWRVSQPVIARARPARQARRNANCSAQSTVPPRAARRRPGRVRSTSRDTLGTTARCTAAPKMRRTSSGGAALGADAGHEERAVESVEPERSELPIVAPTTTPKATQRLRRRRCARPARRRPPGRRVRPSGVVALLHLRALRIRRQRQDEHARVVRGGQRRTPVRASRRRGTG